MQHNSRNMGVIWFPRSQQILQSKPWMKGYHCWKSQKWGQKGKKEKNQEKAEAIFKVSQVGPVGTRAKSFAPLSSSKAITLWEHKRLGLFYTTFPRIGEVCHNFGEIFKANISF